MSFKLTKLALALTATALAASIGYGIAVTRDLSHQRNVNQRLRELAENAMRGLTRAEAHDRVFTCELTRILKEATGATVYVRNSPVQEGRPPAEGSHGDDVLVVSDSANTFHVLEKALELSSLQARRVSELVLDPTAIWPDNTSTWHETDVVVRFSSDQETATISFELPTGDLGVAIQAEYSVLNDPAITRTGWLWSKNRELQDAVRGWRENAQGKNSPAQRSTEP